MSAVDHYAIVVGLNRYPGLASLQGPENDAAWFHQWLIDAKLVDKANAELIVSSKFPQTSHAHDARPDTTEVDRAFERLLRIGVRRNKVGKRLYLFFAGHGFAPNLNESALFMANCELGTGIMGHHVNGVTYADFFAQAAFFDEILLFMDCCRDDLWRAPVRVPPWQPVRDVGGGNVKRFYALATKWAHKAREGKVPRTGAVHGHFTRALMAALEGGAVGRNRKLTTGAVLAYTINYVQSIIKPELERLNIEVPEPKFPQQDDFDLASGLTPASTDVVINFSASTLGSGLEHVLTGGQPPVFVRHPPGLTPWVHALSFGHYTLLDGAQQIVAEFDALGEKVEINV